MRGYLTAAIVILLSVAALAQDSLRIMNPDAGILPYNVAGVEASLTRQVHAPGQRQSLTVSATQPGWAGVYRPGVAAIYAWGNWQDYDRLQFWVRNCNDKTSTISFVVKSVIDGKALNAFKYFTLEPGDQSVTLQLADFRTPDNRPPNVSEVTQWNLGFDQPLEKTLHFGAVSLVRSTKRLMTSTAPAEWKRPKDLTIDVVQDAPRLKLTFPAGATARAWWDIPRSGAPFQAAENRNVWRGYEKLAIDVLNPGRQPTKATLYISDLTAEFRKDKPEYEKQLARVTVSIPPNKSTVEIPLADLKLPDDARDLDLSDVRGIGLEVAADKEPVTLQLDRIRLLTTRDDAGAMPRPLVRLNCPVCGLGISDQYAQQCPTCGHVYRDKPAEAETLEGAIEIPAVADCMAAGGFDLSGGRKDVLAVGRYDFDTYDCRGFIRFDLSSLKLPEGMTVARAEVRLVPDGKCDKPYLPPLDVYAIEGPRAKWDSTKLDWLTQPSASRWIFTGGLYRSTLKTMRLDVTEYVREKATGDKTLSLLIRATTAGPCAHDQHMMGHFVVMHSSKDKDEKLRPRIFIVPEKAK